MIGWCVVLEGGFQIRANKMGSGGVVPVAAWQVALCCSLPAPVCCGVDKWSIALLPCGCCRVCALDRVTIVVSES
jgi:hypothetical protein